MGGILRPSAVAPIQGEGMETMAERRKKTHYVERADDLYGLCGTVAEHPRRTMVRGPITCRRCMFHFLAMQAPWARAFLDDLRGVTRVGTESPPRRATEQVNGPVESPCGGRVGSFSQQGGPQEGVSEILSVAAAQRGIVQPIMDDGWAAALPVRIQKREIPENSGDAGKVSDETLGRGQLSIGLVQPDE